MRRSGLLFVLAIGTTACAVNPKPGMPPHSEGVDARTALHVLNRTTFGPRPGDVERLQGMGIRAYLSEQLRPEALADDGLSARLAPLGALTISARRFAADYYLPMTTARRELANPPRAAVGGGPPLLRWRLLPVAAMTLPGGAKAVTTLQQPTITPEELQFQRTNQRVFDDFQAQKVLRAVYSTRQLEEVLTDFWFNHFNVDARKIEDRPVMVEYERDAIRPYVFGRFRDLLGATAKSPAMLFYLDNWLSKAAPTTARGARPGAPTPPRRTAPGAGAGVNENYARELMELHTLGVDGGYTQRDVVDVARCFTGWTMRNPHDGTGFVFNDTMHDHGEKHVLGHRIRAGRGIEDGEEVLDILARHPATARFVATKLARRFVSDDPPPAVVDRAAKVFLRTHGDLREVVRAILTAPEFAAPAAYRAKVKTPFEFVASALRATSADVTLPGRFVSTIAAMGEPLYQCQPPTGYGDRAQVWMNTGTLIGRLNFAEGLAMNGLNAGAKVDLRDAHEPERLAASLLADDLSAQTRAAVLGSPAPAPVRAGLLLGSPEFQRR